MRRSLSAFLLLALVSSFAARPAAAEQTWDFYFWRDSDGKCMARCSAPPICCPCSIKIPIFTPSGPV